MVVRVRWRRLVRGRWLALAVSVAAVIAAQAWVPRGSQAVPAFARVSSGDVVMPAGGDPSPRPDYVSASLGFRVYGPGASLRFLAQQRVAQAATRSGVGLGWANSAASGTQARAWGLTLASTPDRNIPSVRGVADVVEAMKLPSGSLRGVDIVVLPFSMAGTSGLSWPGVAVIGSRPANSESIPDQLQFTVAHEIGHILQYRCLGPEGGPAWQEFMRIRGIGSWRAGGQAQTGAWGQSVEECFAEDVRITMGSDISAQEPDATDYKDPRDDPKLASSLASFIRRRMSASEATEPKTPVAPLSVLRGVRFIA